MRRCKEETPPEAGEQEPRSFKLAWATIGRFILNEKKVQMGLEDAS